MLKFAPFNVQPNFKNILSLIESNENNSLFEILSQDNFIQSISPQNTKISQYLFNHIADLFDIATDIKFSKQIEKNKNMVNQEKFNDQKIENDNSKIEYENNCKISSNAREALIALSINFPAQFSENPTFHTKMNQILNIINRIEYKSYSESPEGKQDNKSSVKADTQDTNSNDILEDHDDEKDKTNTEINTNISAVLISRIIFSLGKSENYSILASLSDDQDFFPKFCSLLGTHCAVYDSLFTLSNDDMPAVSLFFEDMDTTEVLLEMIKKAIPTIQSLSNSKQKSTTTTNDSKLFLTNYNVLFNYFCIDDIFRMQERALIIITHLISNAEKDSILIKNLSEKYEYMNFIFEDLGLNSLSKEVSANAFSLLIRLYQISSNPNVGNKSSLKLGFNPFMNPKIPASPQQIDLDYDDYDLDYDSDYDSSENFSKMCKKKNEENSKRPKKNPPIKTFLESKFNAICQYAIESKSFSVSTEKALDIICLLLHSPDVQDICFDQNKSEGDLLRKMIQRLADDFFDFPNCSILHTNFRKIFSLIIKIEEQRKTDLSDEKSPFIIKLSNYLKGKIIQILSAQTIDQTAKQLPNNEKITDQENSDNISDITENTDKQTNENISVDIKNENTNDDAEKDQIIQKDTQYHYADRYDFTKYCFWGIIVELADLIESIKNTDSFNSNIYWNHFIQNDVKRFKEITSREYGGPIPQSTRTYGKILCVRSPSSNSSEKKSNSVSMSKATEKLDFGNDSDDD